MLRGGSAAAPANASSHSKGATQKPGEFENVDGADRKDRSPANVEEAVAHWISANRKDKVPGGGLSRFTTKPSPGALQTRATTSITRMHNGVICDRSTSAFFLEKARSPTTMTGKRTRLAKPSGEPQRVADAWSEYSSLIAGQQTISTKGGDIKIGNGSEQQELEQLRDQPLSTFMFRPTSAPLARTGTGRKNIGIPPASSSRGGLSPLAASAKSNRASRIPPAPCKSTSPSPSPLSPSLRIGSNNEQVVARFREGAGARTGRGRPWNVLSPSRRISPKSLLSAFTPSPDYGQAGAARRNSSTLSPLPNPGGLAAPEGGDEVVNFEAGHRRGGVEVTFEGESLRGWDDDDDDGDDGDDDDEGPRGQGRKEEDGVAMMMARREKAGDDDDAGCCSQSLVSPSQNETIRRVLREVLGEGGYTGGGGDLVVSGEEKESREARFVLSVSMPSVPSMPARRGIR